MSAKPVKSKSIPTRFSEEDLVSIKSLAARLDVTDAWVIRHATQLFLASHAESGGMVREDPAPYVAPRKRKGVPQRQQPSQPSHSGKSASG